MNSVIDNSLVGLATAGQCGGYACCRSVTRSLRRRLLAALSRATVFVLVCGERHSGSPPRPQVLGDSVRPLQWPDATAVGFGNAVAKDLTGDLRSQDQGAGTRHKCGRL